MQRRAVPAHRKLTATAACDARRACSTVAAAVLRGVVGLALVACGGASDANKPGDEGPGASGRADDKDARNDRAAPNSAPDAFAFACDEGTAGDPAQLRRLTMTQYRNTLRDLTRWALGDPSEAEQALSSCGLDGVPLDRREATPQDPHGSYRRLDQAVDQSHVDETYRVAAALGSALTTPERLGRVVGECATDENTNNDEMCLTTFLRSFGARALRRPLDADDERFYRAVYGGDPAASAAGYADVLTVMLSSPELLYFVEHGDAELTDSPGSYQLSAYELASRLSYHFWQTLPDDELWQTAQDGSLLEPEVLRQQLERLMIDDRTRATMAELFADWLRLDDLPALDAHAGDPMYTAFAGSDLPSSVLREQVIDDALDMLAYYTWAAPAGLEALFTSELSFARGPELARLYGAETWDGSAEPPQLPAGTRPGILTRAWFLASGSANTRPILRGVFVRQRLLCDDIAPPPDNVNAIPPELRPDKTTRQVVEELTEQRGTACASCHAKLINPLGFAFEGFDALGRVRAEQRLFSSDGRQLGTLPVLTASVPRVVSGDDSSSSGPADLNRLLLQSGKLEACMARHYFRFTFGRYEDLERDGCALERLRARLVESGRIRDMLEEAALLPELTQRRFEPSP